MEIGFDRVDRPTPANEYSCDCTEDLEYVLTYVPYSSTRVTVRLLVSLRTHQNADLLTFRGSGIESDGSSLLPLDSENRVSKRRASALDDIQWM